MNKEIKIIDLLNMIAEGKEVPSIIKYEKVSWFYDDGRDDYYREVLGQGKEYLFQTMFDIKVVYMFINNTVEIIEEDNNKIEKLKYHNSIPIKEDIKDHEMYIREILQNENILLDKINEIIDRLNKED